ncbi:hypothetical protein SBADM41S_01581 [Streptomyces badius]
MCLRTALKPRSFWAFRSKARAASLGWVYSPSGQKPWSSMAREKNGFPLRTSFW